MRIIPALGLLLVTALAGCTGGSDDAEAQPVTADFITPGLWQVNGTTDRILVWAHNPNDETVTGAWGLTLAGGASLPEGWRIRFEPASFSLQADGQKVESNQGVDYPDWGWSVATLDVPSTATAATHDIELRAGDVVVPARMVVSGVWRTTSKAGDQVQVQYQGKFQDTGEVFDAGLRPLPATVGAPGTVTGFGYGLLGLQVGEPATLVVPPGLGYGYDQEGDRAKFNGRVMIFSVKILQSEG